MIDIANLARRLGDKPTEQDKFFHIPFEEVRELLFLYLKTKQAADEAAAIQESLDTRLSALGFDVQRSLAALNGGDAPAATRMLQEALRGGRTNARVEGEGS